MPRLNTGRDDIKEFAYGYDFGGMPGCGEILRISRHEIMRVGRLGAFEEDVIVRVARGGYFFPGRDEQRHLADLRKCLRHFGGDDLKAGSIEDLSILGNNRF